MSSNQSGGIFDPLGGLPPGVGEVGGPSFDDGMAVMDQSAMDVRQEEAAAPPEQHAQMETYEGGGIFDPTVLGPPEDVQDPGPMYPDAPYQDAMDPGQQMIPFEPPYMAQAVGEMPQEHAHMLGLSVVGVAIGTVVGQRYGGTYGAVAGAVGAGALINAYRAFHYYRAGTPEARKEANLSGTYAIGSAVLGAVIWYKWADRERVMTPNVDDDQMCDNPGSCDIRKAGP